MYVLINTLKQENLRVGDPVVLKYDAQTGRIAAFDIDGTVYGFLSDVQPLGGVDVEKLYASIGNYRFITRALAVTNTNIVLSTDCNPCRATGYNRVEQQGYGILVPVA